MTGSYEDGLREDRQRMAQIPPITEPVVRVPLPTIKGQGTPQDPRHPWRNLDSFEEWFSEKQESARHMKED